MLRTNFPVTIDITKTMHPIKGCTRIDMDAVLFILGGGLSPKALGGISPKPMGVLGGGLFAFDTAGGEPDPGIAPPPFAAVDGVGVSGVGLSGIGDSGTGDTGVGDTGVGIEDGDEDEEG